LAMPTDMVDKAKPSRRNENKIGHGQEKRGAPQSKDDRRSNKIIDTFGHHSRVPWTEKETEHVKELMEYLTEQLKEHEGTNVLPKEESYQLLTTLQKFLRQEDIDRNDPLLSKIAYYFNDVKCVDLDKVGQYLKINQKVGDALEHQDVVLLLGNASSGKTTTLHCLAGTTFKEVVVDGFVHLQPTQFLDATVAGYETSCSRTSVTKCLQMTNVKMMDEDFVVCDTPRFGKFDSVEEEISFRHGFIEAISRARKIRPVFVLSQECLGNRMSELPKVFEMMISYFEQDALEEFESLPFQYVFTRFDDRHRTRLCKMLKFYHESASVYEGEKQALFEKVIEDMIQKTTPEANLVCPISDIPRYLLRSLVEDAGLCCEPAHTLNSGLSQAWDLLHVQLKLTLYSLMMFLATHEFEAAVERVRHLSEIAASLPTARTYLDLGLKACERYAIVLWESYNDRMEHNDYISALVHISQSIDLSVALPQLDEYIRLSYDMFWQQFVTMESKTDQALSPEVVKLLRDIAQLCPEIHTEILRGIRGMRGIVIKELQKANSFTSSVPHIRLLLALRAGFPEASNASKELLSRVDGRILNQANEKNFRGATDDLVAIGRLFQEFPNKTRFCVQAIKVYKHNMDQSIDKQLYDQASDTMVYMTQLHKDYPFTEAIVARGLEKLWKQFGSAIKQREYATAVCVIKHTSKLAEFSDTAFERTRLGIEVIRDRLFKSIESKNYGMAQVLMQQLTRLEKALPKVSPGKDLQSCDEADIDSHDRHRTSKERESKAPLGGQRSSHAPSLARPEVLSRKKSTPSLGQDDSDEGSNSLRTLDSESVSDYRTKLLRSDEHGFKKVRGIRAGSREEDGYGGRPRNKEVFQTSDRGNHRTRTRARDDDDCDDYARPSRRHEHEDEHLSDDMMSELTMSVAQARGRKAKHTDARREPPPPISRIRTYRRHDSVPRRSRHESPTHGRLEPSRKGRHNVKVGNHQKRYESPPAREGRALTRPKHSSQHREELSPPSSRKSHRARDRVTSRYESPTRDRRESPPEQQSRVSCSPLPSRNSRVGSGYYKNSRNPGRYDEHDTIPFDEHSSWSKPKSSAPKGGYMDTNTKGGGSNAESFSKLVERERSGRFSSVVRQGHGRNQQERLESVCNSVVSSVDSGSWDI
jgi:energy-coupling factor transporter ATP-binding protein EcfA2